MPGAEPAGKRLAVHARKLALEPDLQVLRRHRRPLLRRLEQTRRSTLEDHVHRPARLGLQVVIRESWYEGVVAIADYPLEAFDVDGAREDANGLGRLAQCT